MVDRDGRELKVGDIITIRCRISVIHSGYLEAMTQPDNTEEDLICVRPGEVRLEAGGAGKRGETKPS